MGMFEPLIKNTAFRTPVKMPHNDDQTNTL